MTTNPLGRSPLWVEIARSYRRHSFAASARPCTIVGRGGMTTTPLRSGLPARIPAVSANTSASMVASGQALRRLRIAPLFGGVRGEALVRPPRGFAPEHPFIEDIKRKSFYAMREESPKLATSPELVDEVSVTFAALSPLMKFLCGAIDVPY